MRITCSWLSAFRWIAAGILGYGLIVVLTTLGFVHWLGGANLYTGGWRLQAQGLLVAVVSGLAGGALAGLLGGRSPLRHALAVLPLLCIDTSYVLFVFPRTTPFWFELLGGLGLIASTLAGGALAAIGRRDRPVDGRAGAATPSRDDARPGAGGCAESPTKAGSSAS